MYLQKAEHDDLPMAAAVGSSLASRVENQHGSMGESREAYCKSGSATLCTRYIRHFKVPDCVKHSYLSANRSYPCMRGLTPCASSPSEGRSVIEVVSIYSIYVK